MDDRCMEIISYYKEILKDLGNSMTTELEDKIIDLYPDETAIDNYVLPIVLTLMSME